MNNNTIIFIKHYNILNAIQIKRTDKQDEYCNDQNTDL